MENERCESPPPGPSPGPLRRLVHIVYDSVDEHGNREEAWKIVDLECPGAPKIPRRRRVYTENA